MTKNDVNAVVKRLLGPSLIQVTADMLAEHQKKALAAGDVDLVTELGMARKEVVKVMAPKPQEPVIDKNGDPKEPAGEAEPKGGTKRKPS